MDTQKIQRLPYDTRREGADTGRDTERRAVPLVEKTSAVHESWPDLCCKKS